MVTFEKNTSIFSIISYINCKLYGTMALKNLNLVWLVLIFARGMDCPNDHIEINEECYYKSHIDVLQDFIDLNVSLNGIKPLQIGYQEWTNHQLTHLYLGELQITSLPDSIGLLKNLNSLDLRKKILSFLLRKFAAFTPIIHRLIFLITRFVHRIPSVLTILAIRIPKIVNPLNVLRDMKKFMVNATKRIILKFCKQLLTTT